MVYAYARLTVTNRDALDSYREKAAEALARHGGKIEATAAAFTVLDGAPDAPDVAALLSFPDKASAVAWAEDPDLTELHTLRRSSGASDILLLG